ncbi:MAG: GDSL family lipase [Planctomycetes bacterium]|jgi:lysophospholipase L1-like esterase|nr:SGNH/GDSL hydrolase family protein [Phycisphaerae bacterium]NBB96231.1 GDSL family lipase [Planctomycetota bacterium]
MSIRIADGATVLFQGDSITDGGRSREDDGQLGGGYANMVAAWYSAAHPERQVRFLNRGIGGNRVKDLQSRWQADCLDLKPDVLSILIGINDVWRRYDSNAPTRCEVYETGYRDILAQVRENLDAHLILLEPFVLPTPPDRETWAEDLGPKRQAAARLADEFDATFVPLHSIFQDAAQHREPAFWASDGVHPSQAGHALIAQAWLSAAGT